MGGKVLVPTREAVQKLISARLAANILDVPTVLIARADADAAQLITSDCDPADTPFITGERTMEGFFTLRGGLAYAPFADMIWCETSQPNLDEARRFAAAIHVKFPGKLLAYNCSPSFHWCGKLSQWETAAFQNQLAETGYRFQLVILAGFHALNLSIFELAHEYMRTGMLAYAQLQEREFELAQRRGYNAVKHQKVCRNRAISTRWRQLSPPAKSRFAHFPDRPRRSSSRTRSTTRFRNRPWKPRRRWESALRLLDIHILGFRYRGFCNWSQRKPNENPLTTAIQMPEIAAFSCDAENEILA